MERLTTRNSEGVAVLKHPYQCQRCGEETYSLPDLGCGRPTDRLCEYEEIGCTPEQLKAVDGLYAELANEVMRYRKLGTVEELQEYSFSGLELANIWAALEKLKKYEAIGTVEECREAVERRNVKKMEVRIWPRQTNERGGYAIMPMKKNIPEGRGDWELATCPECGCECWKIPLLSIAVQQGAIALCSECAMQKGLSDS